MRYINLSTVLVYRLIARKVMNRFPDYNSLIESKLLLPSEVEKLKKVDGETPHESTWAPLLWASKLITKARADGKIKLEPPCYMNLQVSFGDIDAANLKLLNYGWVNFPMAYVHVAHVSVYLYFFAALFGRQYLIPNEASQNSEMFPDLGISYSKSGPYKRHTPDLYFPFFTLIGQISH